MTRPFDSHTQRRPLSFQKVAVLSVRLVFPMVPHLSPLLSPGLVIDETARAGTFCSDFMGDFAGKLGVASNIYR